MTTPVSPGRIVLPVIPVQQINAPPGRLHLGAGETLEAVVLSGNADGKVTLQVKNTSIIAQSRVLLEAGEKIVVRVERTTPSVILRLVGSRQEHNIGDLLRLQRSGSGALLEFFTRAGRMLDMASIETHAGLKAAQTAASLMRLAELCVFSNKTADNPLFIKEMAALLGLTMERDILKEQRERTESVKEMLLKLAAQLNVAGAAGKMKPLAAFLEKGIKSVEAQQLAAVLGQELDRSLVLQAACQFPAEIRLQDIHIDREADNPDGAGRFRAVLFLSMDRLGEIIAAASISGMRMDCVLHCETREACEFLSDLLPELRDRLTAAGYAEPALRCMIEKHMAQAKNDYKAGKKLYSRNAVDIVT